MHFMTFGTNSRDAVIVAFTNCATSVFAAIIIFAIMGFKVTRDKHSLTPTVAQGVTITVCLSLQ